MAATQGDRVIQLALDHHRAGRLADAEVVYRQVLAAEPTHVHALHLLALIADQRGAPDEAVELLNRAIAAQPSAQLYVVLGKILYRRKELPEAVRAFREALARDASVADTHFALGNALWQLRQLDETIASYRQAVSLKPDFIEALGNLGQALERKNDWQGAAAVYVQVLRNHPNDASMHFNLASALHRLGRLTEAAEQYRWTTALQPAHAEAHNNLGNVYQDLGDADAALSAYEAAVRARPDFVMAINNCGALLAMMGRTNEAEDVLRRGIAVAPKHSALHHNLGNVLKDNGDTAGALVMLRRAVELDPSDARAHSNLIFALNFSATKGSEILAECRKWNERHAAPLRSQIKPHLNDKGPDRRLRIGYVSPDFREHVLTFFTCPLLSHHDRSAFEIFCYSSVKRPDALTRRIMQCAEHWRDVRLLDDPSLAEQVRADRIDVLVDLTMHMADGRPLLFARKPAPVQIAWEAYPGTTGIETMDFRISDPRLDPPGADEPYTEETIRLPDSFWCYDPLNDGPQVNDLPALSSGKLTFGCLNNPCKLGDHTFRLWGETMRRILNSRLLVLEQPGRGRDNLLARMKSQGIDPERVEFVAHRRREEYLRTYHQIDVVLDTFPYTGHTTTLDSLWMGVPVVTRIGPTVVGRGSFSQLFHLDLLDLAADSEEKFVEAAVRITSDLPRLAKLRGELRTRLTQSPLMDAARFARGMESAYRMAFGRWCSRSN